MSASAKTGAQAGQRLGYLFKHAGLLMSELNDAVLAPFGIEPRELGILIVIDSFEPASQQQVAERIGIDRTTSAVAASDSAEAELLAPLTARRGHTPSRPARSRRGPQASSLTQTLTGTRRLGTGCTAPL